MNEVARFRWLLYASRRFDRPGRCLAKKGYGTQSVPRLVTPRERCYEKKDFSHRLLRTGMCGVPGASRRERRNPETAFSGSAKRKIQGKDFSHQNKVPIV